MRWLPRPQAVTFWRDLIATTPTHTHSSIGHGRKVNALFQIYRRTGNVIMTKSITNIDSQSRVKLGARGWSGELFKAPPRGRERLTFKYSNSPVRHVPQVRSESDAKIPIPSNLYIYTYTLCIYIHKWYIYTIWVTSMEMMGKRRDRVRWTEGVARPWLMATAKASLQLDRQIQWDGKLLVGAVHNKLNQRQNEKKKKKRK